MKLHKNINTFDEMLECVDNGPSPSRIKFSLPKTYRQTLRKTHKVTLVSIFKNALYRIQKKLIHRNTLINMVVKFN